MNSLQIVLLVVVMVAGPSVACRGCVDLDDLTYDKLLKKFRWTLVKFDVAFPYGDKHEAYSELAKEMAGVDDLMVATVGIKDYGEKDNNELGARYGIKEGDFPVVKLFKNGLADAPINFDQAVTSDNLKSFLRTNTGLYIGLAGCLENFDKLAAAFIQALPNAKTEHEKAKELAKALEANQPQNHELAKNYLMIMSRIEDKGETFVAAEKQRLVNILKTKLTDKKKQELTHRLNVLEAFRRPSSGDAKTEL